MAVFGLAERPLRTPLVRRRLGDWIFAAGLAVLVGYGAYRVIGYISTTIGFAEVGHALALGLVTFGRVVAVVTVRR